MAGRTVLRELLVRLGVIADTRKVAEYRQEVDTTKGAMVELDKATAKAAREQKRAAAEVERAQAKARREMEKSVAEAKKFDSELRGGLISSLQEMSKVALVGGAGLLAIGVGIVKAGFAAAETGNRVAKVSQQVNVGVEAYQELEYATRSAGAQADQLRDVLKTIATTSYDASKGAGEMAEVYAKLGIDPKTEGRMKTADVLLGEIADKANALKDGSSNALIQRVLGEDGGVNLIPLLKGGSAGINALRREARELGFVLDAEATRKAEEFQHELLNAQLAGEGLRNELGVALLPALTELLDGFVQGARHVRPFVKGIAEAISRTIGWKVALAGLFGGATLLISSGVLLAIAAALGTVVSGLSAFAAALGIALVPAALLAVAALGQFILTFGIIIAVLTTAGLVVEDFIGWLNGADSVLGRLIARAEQTHPAIKSLFDLFRAGQGVMLEVLGVFYEVARIVVEMGFAQLQTEVDGALATLGALYDLLSSLIGLDVAAAVASWTEPIAKFFGQVEAGVGGVRGGLAEQSGAQLYGQGRQALGTQFAPTAPGRFSTIANSVNNSTTINAPMTINAANAADAGQQVGGALQGLSRRTAVPGRAG